MELKKYIDERIQSRFYPIISEHCKLVVEECLLQRLNKINTEILKWNEEFSDVVRELEKIALEDIKRIYKEISRKTIVRTFENGDDCIKRIIDDFLYEIEYHVDFMGYIQEIMYDECVDKVNLFRNMRLLNQ